MGIRTFQRKAVAFLLSCLCSLFFFSCGLETSYYVDSPAIVGTSPSHGSADKALHFFCFRTAGDTSNGSFSYLGTEIYYKIYNNVSLMESRVSSLESVPDSSRRDSLISYGYKTLNLGGGAAPSPLIQESDVYAYIRLADYNTSNSPDYKAVICTSSSAMTRYEGSATLIGEPRRNINSGYGFDFGRDSSNPVPVSSDSDYSASSATVRDSYYIDVYAVTVGEDTADGTKSYSGAVHLGSVTVSTSDNF